MGIVIDRSLCVGAGMCALSAPGVFDQDPDEGTVTPVGGAAPDPGDPAVRRAVDTCPSGAITLAP
ncbi:ferredoxin [Nocardiopsis sp. CC223A]|uniref:ferredoxin n=1 Tax=Nocardiopsis sp. CC223A TaxID=3044051 RepID=UPI00278C0333|nr:ferredoxin [Nocardiopsis sp. CC223A]